MKTTVSELLNRLGRGYTPYPEKSVFNGLWERWNSPIIPQLWGERFQQIVETNNIEPQEKVCVEFRAWTSDSGNDFRYHYQLEIKIGNPRGLKNPLGDKVKVEGNCIAFYYSF